MRTLEYFWLPLLPLSFLWALLVTLRRRFLSPRAYRSSLRTICVGNLHAGGTGKTPLVAWLAKELKSFSPVIVSRGFGGKKSKSGAWVDLAAGENWVEFGDEPVFLAQSTGRPVRIGANRADSARAIESRYPGSLLLMDDGFQNFDLKHDVDIVVLPDVSGWQERYCHPVGTLREPASVLKNATAVVLVQTLPSLRTPGDWSRRSPWKPFLAAHFPTLPVFEIRPVWGGLFQNGEKYTVTGNEIFGVFSGIARADRFFSSIQSQFPSQSRWFKSFPDHHGFSPQDLKKLNASGAVEGVSHWIVTEKDRVRLSPQAMPRPILTARVEYDIPEGLMELVIEKLEQA